LNDKTIFHLIDESLSAKSIERNKFNSIVKLLMKKSQGERLYNLTMRTCENFFKFTNGSEFLSMQEKLNLVYTARTVLETNKIDISGELYRQYESRLNELS